MIRWAIVAVVALTFGATTALSFQESSPVAAVGIDLDSAGNTGNSIGTVESCRSIDTGTAIEVDVFVLGVPPAEDGLGGIAAFGYNLHFDPAVVRITAVVDTLMLGAASPFEVIDADANTPNSREALPATTGNIRIDYADISADYESGDGVLSRLTVEAIGPGTTTLTLTDDVGVVNSAPLVVSGASEPYDISQLQNAKLTVGEPCESPPSPVDPVEQTPGASGGGEPTPGGTDGTTEPTPEPTFVPVGDTSLAVDVVTTGNNATEIGEIDTCAAADLNESFQVDIVIQKVTNLLAWEVPLSYDPEVLRVDDRDVELFQAANEGSQVHDASAITPDISGTYFASAVDTSEPARPDSGDGVLVRLIMTAIGEGTSDITIRPVDLTGDNRADRGILLRDVNSAIIGTSDGDTFFDGPAAGAEVRVGDTCVGGGRVVPGESSTGGPGPSNGGDGGSNTVWVVIAVIAVLVALAGGSALFILRKRGPGPAA